MRDLTFNRVLGGTVTQPCEAREHRAKPIEQREQVLRLVARRQTEELQRPRLPMFAIARSESGRVGRFQNGWTLLR